MGTDKVEISVKKLLAHSPFLYLQASRAYKGLKGILYALRTRVGHAHAEALPSSPPVVVGNSDSASAAPSPEKPGIKVVTTLEELDAQLKLVDEAGQRSDDDLRKVLASFEFGLTQNVPDDPYGEAYRQQQHDLYLTISGGERLRRRERAVGVPGKPRGDRPAAISLLHAERANGGRSAYGARLHHQDNELGIRI